MKKILLLLLMAMHLVQADNVGLLVVATGKYIEFVPPLLASARKHFCPNQTVTYFIFTDGQLEDKAEDVVVLPWKRLGWPYDTMLRFKAYYDNYEQLKAMDYLFACDADMLFLDTVGDEILSERVGTMHPGYVGRRGTYEDTRTQSTAYVAPHEGEYYFAGGFYGGATQEFFAMMQTVLTNIALDLKNNIIAVWHDESHLNRYFIDHKPTVVLPRAYCARPFDTPQKLIALDKNHAEFRK